MQNLSLAAFGDSGNVSFAGEVWHPCGPFNLRPSSRPMLLVLGGRLSILRFTYALHDTDLERLDLIPNFLQI